VLTINRTLINSFILVLTTSTAVSLTSSYLTIIWDARLNSGISFAFVMASYSLAKIIVAPLAGYYSTKFGVVFFMKTGALLCALCFAGYTFLPADTYVYVLMQVLCGFGLGLIRPMTMALLCFDCEIRSKGRALGILELAFYISLATGPVLGGLIYQLYGPIWLFRTAFIICFLGLGATFTLTETIATENNSVNNHHIDIIRRKGLFFIYFFCRAFGVIAISAFLPILLKHKQSTSLISIGLVIMTVSLSSAVSLPFFGKLSEKINKMAGLTLSSIAVSALTSFLPYISDLSLLFVSVTALGLCASFAKACSMNILAEEIARRDIALGMGILNSTMTFGFMIAAFTGGVIIKYYNIDTVFYIFGFIGILGTLLMNAGSVVHFFISRYAAKDVKKTTINREFQSL